MIDYDLVRAYYFDPPPRDPERIPSDEELLARSERRRVERLLPRGGQQAAVAFLADLAGAHLAGVPNRPGGQRLGRMFRSPRLSAPDRAILAQLFGAVPPPRFKELRYVGGISLYEIARAVHATGTRRNALVRWLNRFAVRPKATA